MACLNSRHLHERGSSWFSRLPLPIPFFPMPIRLLPPPREAAAGTRRGQLDPVCPLLGPAASKGRNHRAGCRSSTITGGSQPCSAERTGAALRLPRGADAWTSSYQVAPLRLLSGSVILGTGLVAIPGRLAVCFTLVEVETGWSRILSADVHHRKKAGELAARAGMVSSGFGGRESSHRHRPAAVVPAGRRPTRDAYCSRCGRGPGDGFEPDCVCQPSPKS